MIKEDSLAEIPLIAEFAVTLWTAGNRKMRAA
jgi:hypothetical protein